MSLCAGNRVKIITKKKENQSEEQRQYFIIRSQPEEPGPVLAGGASQKIHFGALPLKKGGNRYKMPF